MKPTPKPKQSLAIVLGLVGLASLGAGLPHAQALPTPTLVLCEKSSLPVSDLLFFWDYGDAPDSAEGGGAFTPYPTWYVGGGNPNGFFPTLSDTTNAAVAGQPGARHQVVNVAWLGNNTPYETLDWPLAPTDVPPSLENDADLTFDQDGSVTNLDPATLTPDHDGHDNGLYAASLTTGTTAPIQFRVSTYPGIIRWYVNVLIDWNYDGKWAGTDPNNGAPEWAVTNFFVTVNPMSSTIFTDLIQVGTTPGEPWTRITLTKDPIGVQDWDGSVPTGTFDFFGRPAFPCGETEDYCGRLLVTPKLAPEEPRPAEGIRCDPPIVHPTPDPCTDGGADLAYYDVDLGTGRTGGVQDNWYDLDDDWTVTQIGGGPAGSPDVFSVKPHPAWYNPAVGNWINPQGNTFYSATFENNHGDAALGAYTYEMTFPVSPQAAGVLFDFDWWRDDATLATAPFEYFDEGLNAWVMLGFGSGFNTASMSTVAFLETPTNPSNSYTIRVTVDNGQTFTGLLVEGHARVYCGNLPFDPPFPDLGDPVPFDPNQFVEL